jgi:hypothetical protein
MDHESVIRGQESKGSRVLCRVKYWNLEVRIDSNRSGYEVRDFETSFVDELFCVAASAVRAFKCVFEDA